MESLKTVQPSPPPAGGKMLVLLALYVMLDVAACCPVAVNVPSSWCDSRLLDAVRNRPVAFR